MIVLLILGILLIMRIWYYLSPNVYLVKSGNKYLLILYYSVSNKRKSIERKSIVLFTFTR